MGERQDRSQHSSHADRSHEQTRASLPGYATAMALGQAPELVYSEVADHLRDCSVCRAELDDLLELVMPTYDGRLIPVADIPHFDLSFLGAPAVKPGRPSWFIDQLHLLVIEFSDALLATIQQSAFAQAARGAALYHYDPDPPPANLDITIDVFASDDDPQFGNVQVLLDIPSRDPFDQGGTNVTLRIGELIWQNQTAQTGTVTFGAVPLARLAQLRVEIALPADT